VTIWISPDEEIEIYDTRGLEDRQLAELEGMVADMMELLDYESHTYDVKKFMAEINDWLYYRTGDEMFRDKKREEEEKQEKLRKKKEEEARKKALEEAERKRQEEFHKKNRTRFANMLGSMSYEERQRLLRAVRV
jgi:hypothetical protein